MLPVVAPSAFTRYRVYPDGNVVHEDDFNEYDDAQPYCDDYRRYRLPDELVAAIELGA
jgi:hypothetical protein